MLIFELEPQVGGYPVWRDLSSNATFAMRSHSLLAQSTLQDYCCEGKGNGVPNVNSQAIGGNWAQI